MIEENGNYKVMFYFLSPNVFVICLVFLLSNEGVKHQFHLSEFFCKLNFFGKQREFTIKIKTC